VLGLILGGARWLRGGAGDPDALPTPRVHVVESRPADLFRTAPPRAVSAPPLAPPTASLALPAPPLQRLTATAGTLSAPPVAPHAPIWQDGRASP